MQLGRCGGRARLHAADGDAAVEAARYQRQGPSTPLPERSTAPLYLFHPYVVLKEELSLGRRVRMRGSTSVAARACTPASVLLPGGRRGSPAAKASSPPPPLAGGERRLYRAPARACNNRHKIIAGDTFAAAAPYLFYNFLFSCLAATYAHFYEGKRDGEVYSVYVSLFGRGERRAYPGERLKVRLQRHESCSTHFSSQSFIFLRAFISFPYTRGEHNITISLGGAPPRQESAQERLQ